MAVLVISENPHDMITLKNLCYRTDAIFHLRDGFVEEHADYYAIRTPSNPSFWFGNLIIFKRAPLPGDLDRWLRIHESVFGMTLNHITLGWDENRPGVTQEFIAAGFKVDDGIVLSMSSYAGGVPINPDFEVRKLQTDSDWKQITDLQIEIDRDDMDFGEDDGVFRTTQMNSLRTMAEEGHGDWWGAFHESQLVGGMGLYFDEDRTVGRFQYVTTRATHRRQRVCTTLLDQVVRDAFTTVRPDQLVINTGADPSNPAIKVYENFGFTRTMRCYALHKHL